MPDFSYCRYLPRWTVVWIVNSTILYHLLYPPCVCRSCLACCYILQKASQLLIARFVKCVRIEYNLFCIFYKYAGICVVASSKVYIRVHF